MKKIMIFLLVASLSAVNVLYAAERQIRDVCDVSDSTEVSISLKVTAGKDACVAKKCFASIYEGTLTEDADPDLKKCQQVQFTTSSRIQIGDTYKFFADRVGASLDDRRIVFLGAGYEEFYVVPEGVGFYVPLDGAFLKARGGYYRTVWPGCEGGANECSYMQKYDSRDTLMATVAAQDIEHLARCEKNPAR